MKLQNREVFSTSDGWINLVKWTELEYDCFGWFGKINDVDYGNWVKREPTSTETDESITNTLIQNAKDTKKSL